MSNQTVAERIATLLAQRANIAERIEQANRDQDPPAYGHWAQVRQNNAEALRDVERDWLPSGSGFDSGTRIDLDASRPDCIVLRTSFHHMDDNGFYCGWTHHTARVRPSFVYGISLTLSGRDYRGIKDYIHEALNAALQSVYMVRA